MDKIDKKINDQIPTMIALGVAVTAMLVTMTFTDADAQVKQEAPVITKQADDIIVTENVQTVVDLVQLQAEIDGLKTVKSGLEGQITNIQDRLIGLSEQIAAKQNLLDSIIKKFPEEQQKLEPAPAEATTTDVTPVEENIIN